METCKECGYFIDKYLQTPPMGQMVIVSIEDNDKATLSIPWVTNEEGTGICNNEFSPYYEHGISNCNYCEYFTKKEKYKSKKERQVNNKTGLGVFDNYVCDGQIAMDFSGEEVKLIEE